MLDNLSKLNLIWTIYCSDQRSGVAGVTLQQQLEWHPGWWDGSRQNDPDYRPHHLPHGVQAHQWALPHHRTSLVSVNVSPRFPVESIGLKMTNACRKRLLFLNQSCSFVYRTLSNWVYEFDKWAPSVVKVSYKVSDVALVLQSRFARNMTKTLYTKDHF